MHAAARLVSCLQTVLRKNPLETSSTAQHEAHTGLAQATRACQEAVHAALLDNIHTAAALDELLSARPLPCCATAWPGVAWSTRACSAGSLLLMRPTSF